MAEELTDYFPIRVKAWLADKPLHVRLLSKPFSLWLRQDGWAMDEYGKAFRYDDLYIDRNELHLYMTDGIIYQYTQNKFIEHRIEPSQVQTYIIKSSIKKILKWRENIAVSAQ